MNEQIDNKLDEILVNYLDQARVHIAQGGDYLQAFDEAKQAILQWVADEVVGKDENRPSGIIANTPARNYFRDEQRQILKREGWKK